MPAKQEAKKQAKAAVRRLTMQLGKATVAAAMETAGDEDDDDDDDDDDADTRLGRCQRGVAPRARNVPNHFHVDL